VSVYIASSGGAVVFGTPRTDSIAIAPPSSGSIRIIQIDYTFVGAYQSAAPNALIIAKNVGGSITAGTTITPAALRDGSVVLSTVKSSATVSGTQNQLVNQANITASSTYKPPSDLICNGGTSIFFVSLGPSSTSGGYGSQSIAVYYDEFHLARSG